MLVEGGPYVLATFPDRLRDAARKALERLGVEVRTGAVVIGIDADGVTCRDRGAQTSADDRADRRPRPCSGLPAWPRRRSRSRSACRSIASAASRPSRRWRLPAHPKIFVVGDLCAFTQDGKPLPGVAQVAMQQGAQAARNVRRAIEGEPLEPFRYKDYGNMATIGRGSAVGDIFGLKISGFFAWLFWLFLHIFWLIGFRNRFVVMTEWAWAYFSLQRRVRLITGDRAS